MNSSSLQSSRPARLQRGSVREAVGHERGQRHGPRLPPGPAHLHRPEHRRLADQRAGEQVKLPSRDFHLIFIQLQNCLKGEH